VHSERKVGLPANWRGKDYMKNEKIKYVITRIRIFTKKAMKVISSWFNVKHS
jgi:hypothetical protein